MKKIILLLFLLIIENLFAQTNPYTIPLLPQGYSINLLNGYGNSALYNDVANITSINPAALQNFNQTAFGLSYQGELKIKNSWGANIGSERINKLTPQSIGFVYAFENAKIGLSMYQKYNRTLLFDKIEKTTEENPDGIGEFFIPEYKTYINNYSISAAYTFDNIFSEASLSLGFRIGLNYLQHYEKLNILILDESLSSTDFTIGLVYSTVKSNDKYLKLGLLYESELEFNKLANYNFTESRPINDYLQNIKMNITAQLPASLRFDIDLSTIDNIKLLGSISNIFWSNIDDNIKNQIELSGSALYTSNESIVPSVGFLYSDRNYKSDDFNFNKNLNALFLTAGVVLKYQNLNLHLVVADSHLFSGEWRRQTIFKSNLSYRF